MWAFIPGYEGLYEASTDGRIRTSKGKTTQNKKFPKRVWKQRELKYSKRYRHQKSSNYDYMVTLWKDNKPHKYLVARLIAATYHGNYLDTNLTVNHIDGNSLNNNASNLEWLTRADNIKYGFKNGQYLSNTKRLTIMSEFGIVVKLDSYSETDRFLNQYNGYTSRAMMLGVNQLKSKKGIIYYVKNE